MPVTTIPSVFDPKGIAVVPIALNTEIVRHTKPNPQLCEPNPLLRHNISSTGEAPP